ncbi:MAG TPA: dienelactone hydrolase family protein [Gemmatimonadales bacterium]|nr:dienelactone hydrolase family protein [Gemmatimonadales bacterium]
MLDFGERLAKHGYLVLLPDLFDRSGPYAPMNAKTVFADPEERKILSEKFMSRATLPNIMSDTAAFLDFLAAQRDARPGPLATTGYCMGGAASVSAAGTYPDRISAAAAYHPSRLTTDAPESPHRLASSIKARVYVAAASDDASLPDDMKARFDQALTAAGVDHVLETYPARHGFVLRDTPAFDAAAHERHWQTLTKLLKETV